MDDYLADHGDDLTIEGVVIVGDKLLGPAGVSSIAFGSPI
jgi:hypothetical protein